MAASAPRYVAPVAMLTFSLTIVSSDTVWNNRPVSVMSDSDLNIVTYRLSLIIFNPLQESVLEERPGLPDGADTDNVEAARASRELRTDAGGESSDVTAQHPPRLSEQPHTEPVTCEGGLRYGPGQGGELGLAEVVVAVTQQAEPEHGSETVPV